jgi:hypothetical protein
MPSTPLLGAYGSLSNTSISFRNVLINGGFDIWQRGTSQTTSGYGSDDRWGNENVGSTKTASRQTFTLGQTDVPGNPRYWARTVVSSVAGASNSCNKIQRVESVLTLAGQQATVSFWAKADASKNMAVEFVQWFGSGGGASSAVTSIGVTTIPLTTSWQKFTVSASIPSITGKVIGTSGDDHLALIFWFDAGSASNSRTNSLGQQSGTFDISNVQLEAGSVATPFEQRPIGTELSLCQRYYEKSFNLEVAPANNLGDNRLGVSVAYATNTVSCNRIIFKSSKRTTGTMVLYNSLNTTSNSWSGFVTGAFVTTGTVTPGFDQNGFVTDVSLSGAATGSAYLITGHWAAACEL